MNSYPTLRRTASIWIALGFILATLSGLAGVFILIGGDYPSTGLVLIVGGFVTVLLFQTISHVLLLLIDIADSLSARRETEQTAPQITRKPKG